MTPIDWLPYIVFSPLYVAPVFGNIGPLYKFLELLLLMLAATI